MGLHEGTNFFLSFSLSLDLFIYFIHSFIYLFFIYGHCIHLQKSPRSKLTCRKVTHLTKEFVVDIRSSPSHLLLSFIVSISLLDMQGE